MQWANIRVKGRSPPARFVMIWNMPNRYLCSCIYVHVGWGLGAYLNSAATVTLCVPTKRDCLCSAARLAAGSPTKCNCWASETCPPLPRFPSPRYTPRPLALSHTLALSAGLSDCPHGDLNTDQTIQSPVHLMWKPMPILNDNHGPGARIGAAAAIVDGKVCEHSMIFFPVTPYPYPCFVLSAVCDRRRCQRSRQE